MEQLDPAVLAPHVRLIWLEEVADAVTDPGMLGAEAQVMPVTVSVAELLRTVWPALLTATVNAAPLSVANVAGVV
jgi:hypothetical protein